MKQTTKTLLLIALSFGVYFILDASYFMPLKSALFKATNHLGISHMATYTISIIPLLLGTLLITGRSGFFISLGLHKPILKSFFFALGCTLPMYLGFGFLFKINPEISTNSILISVVAAGFFEEFIFRGFLFGLLFQKTRLGFLPAVLFSALYFGLLHLYQSSELLELIGIFTVTFLGGILFAWVYVEWKFTIWVPILLHALMNLSWELFSVSENALGSLYANVFRFLTIALIIGLTVLFKRKMGYKLAVNRKNLLKKSFS